MAARHTAGRPAARRRIANSSRITVYSNASEMMLAAAAGDKDASQAIRQVEHAVKRLHGFARAKKECAVVPVLSGHTVAAA
jgi:hypothetical protein